VGWLSFASSRQPVATSAPQPTAAGRAIGQRGGEAGGVELRRVGASPGGEEEMQGSRTPVAGRGGDEAGCRAAGRG